MTFELVFCLAKISENILSSSDGLYTCTDEVGTSKSCTLSLLLNLNL